MNDDEIHFVPQHEDVTFKKWRALINPKVVKKIFNIGKKLYDAQAHGGININVIKDVAKDGLDIINKDLGGVNLNDLKHLGGHFSKFFK